MIFLKEAGVQIDFAQGTYMTKNRESNQHPFLHSTASPHLTMDIANPLPLIADESEETITHKAWTFRRMNA